MINSESARLCPLHKDEKLKLFCENCDQPLCCDCLLQAHRSHSLISLSEASLKNKASIESMLQDTRDHLQELKESIKTASEAHLKVEMKAKSVEGQIKEEFLELHKLIDKRESVLLQELEELTAQKLHKLSLEKKRLEDVHGQVERSCGMAEAWPIEEMDDLEFILVKNQVAQYLRSACEERQKIQQQSATNNEDCFGYDPFSHAYEQESQQQVNKKEDNEKRINQQPYELSRMIENHGRIVNNFQASSALIEVEVKGDQQMVSEQVDYEKVEDDSGTGGDLTEVKEVPTESSDESVEEGKKSVEVPVIGKTDDSSVTSSMWQEKGEHKVDMLNNQQLYGSSFVIDHLEGKRDFSTVGKSKLALGSEGSTNGLFQYPCSVDMKEGHIIVADQWNHRIQVFDSTGCFLHAFGSCGSSPGQFQDPYSVAVDKEGHIIVADTHNHRIQVFDIDGGFLYAFGSCGSAPGQFQGPYSVVVDNKEGHIIVADTYNHRVQVFDNKGGFLHTFGSRGLSLGQFEYPCSVAVDMKKGHVIVADTDNHRVQVFDSKGGFVHAFGSRGSSHGQFRSPISVTVDSKEGHIIVADNGNNRVQVFDSKGLFLHTFGSRGSSHGQFQSPVSVAVDNEEGHIIVADSNNNRIQMF